MKKYAFLIGILLLPLCLRAQDPTTAGINFVTFNPLEVFPVNKFGGLNTDDDPLTLVDQSPDSQNVVTDDGPGLTGRKGFVSLSTESLKAMWVLPHSSGSRYKIGQSSGTLKASLDGITYNITISTVDPQYTTAGAVIADAFYFSDLTNGLKKATFAGNVATVVTVSTALRFSMLISAQGRLMGAGIPGSERILRISEYTPNETNFTLVANSSDTMPAAITISGALDEPISGLYASFRGYPVIFRPHSFGILTGTRRSNFGFQKYSEQTGTSYPESVQDCDGLLRWLGPARTIWEFNGVGWKDITNDPTNKKRISSLMSTVAEGDASEQSFTITTQSDYEAGTSSGVSTSLFPGSIALSTWTALDEVGADYAQGTSVNMDTTTRPGDLILSVNNGNLSDNGFESDTWVAESNGMISGPGRVNSENGVGAQSGAYFERVYSHLDQQPKSTVVQILDSNGNLLGSTEEGLTLSTDGRAWLQRSVDLSPYIGKDIYLKFYVRSLLDSGKYGAVRSATHFICSGGTFTYYFYLYETLTLGGPYYVYFDSTAGGQSTISQGTFVSRTFDTAFSSPAWLSTQVADGSNGNTMLYETQSSTDGVTFDSLATWTNADTTGGAPASAYKRFIRYKVTITTASGSTGQPYVNNVPLAARSQHGLYVSNSIPVGTKVSAWGVFSVTDRPDSGSLTYGFYTDSDTVKTISNGVVSGFVSSQTITSYTIPTVATNSYCFVTALLQNSVNTQDPKNDDITIHWEQGTFLRVASAFANKRYWLAVAISSTANNRVLVYDKNQDWQLYNGINADAMVFDSNVYFSNHAGVFQGETGYNDNGASIQSYYKTPTLGLGGLDNWVKFHSLRITTAQSASTLSTTYQFNGNGTDYSFGSYAMNQATGYQNFKLPFPATEVSQGKFLNLKFAVTGTAYWRILNASIYHMKDVLPR